MLKISVFPYFPFNGKIPPPSRRGILISYISSAAGCRGTAALASRKRGRLQEIVQNMCAAAPQPLRFGHRCSAEMLRVVLRKRKMVDDDMVSEYMLLDKFPALPQGDPREIQQCKAKVLSGDQRQ